MTRSPHIERLEAKLQEWSADMSKLLAKARAKRADGLEALQDKVEQLHDKREALAKRLDQLKNESAESYDKVKADVEDAWNTLHNEGRRLWRTMDSPQTTSPSS